MNSLIEKMHPIIFCDKLSENHITSMMNIYFDCWKRFFRFSPFSMNYVDRSAKFALVQYIVFDSDGIED